MGSVKGNNGRLLSDGATVAQRRQHLLQRKVVEKLQARGELILDRDDGWVTLTSFAHKSCYHVGPRGQVRTGSWSRHESVFAPWVAQVLDRVSAY